MKHILSSLLLTTLLLLTACSSHTKAPPPVLSKQARYESVGSNMVISMPEDWSYTEFLITGGDDGTSDPIHGFTIYPDADPEAVVTVACDGLYETLPFMPPPQAQPVYANGYPGSLFYLDLGTASAYRILYPELPGIYSVTYSFTNAQMNAYANTVDAILDALIFAEGIIGRNAACLIASAYKDAEDDTLLAEYHPADGTWTVSIFPAHDVNIPSRHVILDTKGKVLAVRVPQSS